MLDVQTGYEIDKLKAAVASNTGTIASVVGGNLANGATVTGAFKVVNTTLGSTPAPVMTAVQFAAIAAPTDGLMAYDSTNHVLKLYQNGAWKTVTTA